MGSLNLLLCILAVTVIGATGSVTLNPMIGPENTKESWLDMGGPQGTEHNFTEMPLNHSLALAFGRWNVLNDMPDPISVHCHSQLMDLGTSSLMSGKSMNLNFPIDPHYQELWYCDFKWSSPTGALEQSFEVWAHDGLTGFLWRCLDCEWKVERDGFYYKEALDGKFYHQWDWLPWNGQPPIDVT